MIFPPPFCFIDRRHPSMTFRLPVLHWGLDAGSFRLRTLPIIFSQIFLPVPPISCLDAARRSGGAADRKSVVWGKSVSVRVDLGGRLCINKKKKIKLERR